MAIMGASGAGKSTFLDILARKGKRGIVSGTTLVNGREVTNEEFRNVIGFVDQEDTLMSTLTVYETVLYSALLRLPREMSIEAKKFRTLETLNELGILGIRDSRIGDSGLCLSTRADSVLTIAQATGPSPAVKNGEYPLPANLSHLLQYFSSTNLRAGWTPSTHSASSPASFRWRGTTTALSSSQSTNLAATLSPFSINCLCWLRENSSIQESSPNANSISRLSITPALLASISLISSVCHSASLSVLWR